MTDDEDVIHSAYLPVPLHWPDITEDILTLLGGGPDAALWLSEAFALGLDVYSVGNLRLNHDPDVAFAFRTWREQYSVGRLVVLAANGTSEDMMVHYGLALRPDEVEDPRVQALYQRVMRKISAPKVPL